MSRFTFSSRRSGFGLTRRKPGNKGRLSGLNLGIGLFIVFISLQFPEARPAALLGIPFLLAAWFVLKEQRLGLILTYLAAALAALLSVVTLVLTGKLIFGLVIAFAVYFLIKQATQFDAYLEQKELDALDGAPTTNADTPVSAKERFERQNAKARRW